ncbi:translocation/assembly module TamB domain-containing protein [Bacteroidales bacterium OttesenSCG-928-K03]|nr:translocation/assembly module TamB domain-containing protein [Odoribacter sp. OttesenSCG-928-L07]MDL2242596.1 translocation/assembly module TamB domain-containing protein [Bacteroidales bacterium OttesenSCG-928-K03]
MKIKRIFKIFFKTIGIIILILFLALLSTGLLLQIPFVQNFVAKISINALSKQINTEISLEKIKYSRLNTIELHNVRLNDTHNNLVMSIGYAKVQVRRLSLKQKVFHLKEVIVRDLIFNHIKYENSEKSNLLMIFPAQGETTGNTNSKPLTVLGDYVRIYNWAYKYKDYNHKEEMMHIDFLDISVVDAYGEFMDLTVINDSVSVQILNLKLKEEKGFDIKSFNTDFTISSTTLRALNTGIVTNNSDFSIDLIFNYPDWGGYSYFTDSVYIIGKIRKNSLIDLNDISYFTSVLAGAENLVELSTEVNGPVNNMHIKDIDLSMFDVTYYAGDVFLKDVDKGNIYLGLDIKNFITNYSDAQTFKVPAFEDNVYDPKTLILPKELEKLGVISLSGNFAGEFDNFKTDISAETDMGYVFADVKYNKISKSFNDFSVQLNGSKVNIGEILNLKPKISTVDLKLEVDGIAEKFIPQTFNLSGNIEKARLEKVTLSDLQFQASKDDEQFLAHASIFNEELFLDASLNAITNAKPAIVNTSIAINHANLPKLGLMNYDEGLIVGGFLNANLTGNNIDDLRAQINATNLTITAGKQLYTLGDISLSHNSTKNWDKVINFNSNFLDFIIEGNFMYNDLISYFSNIINTLIPHITQKIENIDSDIQLQAFINLKQPEIITFSIPDLDISQNTSMFLNIDNTTNLSIDLYSENISYLTYNLNEINFYSDYIDSTLVSELTVNNVFLGDLLSNSSIIDVSDFVLKNNLTDNLLSFDLMWHDTIYDKNTHLKVNADINRLPVFVFNIPDDSYISLQNKSWDISTEGNIEIGDSFYSIESLRIDNDSSSLFVDGKYSKDTHDSLNIGFRNINISPINLFFEENMGISGILNGDGAISYLGVNPYFAADIKLEKIIIKENYLGDLFFNTRWEDEIKAIDLDMSLVDRRSNSNDSIMIVSGYYYPLSKNGDINGMLTFNNFDFSFVEPFLSSVITDPQGYISGKVDIRNSLTSPALNGTLNFKNAALTVKFTKAKYTFSNSIDIIPGAVVFDSFKLFDAAGKSFDLSGRISHNNWKNFGLSLHTNFDRFTFLDNELDMFNQAIFGKAILSGTASLEGGFDDLEISADVNTEPGTKININLASNKTASQHSFIHFVSYDEDSIVISQNKEKQSNAFKINAMANLKSNAQLNIILPYSLGEMSIIGTGDIAYKQNNDGKFNVVGDYYVNSGSVKFNYQDFLSMDFTIKEGGGIIFNGDPMNAIMNIEAVYHLRASLSGIQGISEDENQRVPVDCIISFTGQLSDPIINFDIELPNVDETTKSFIYAAIDMNDQTAVAEQVFYLLLLKSFYVTSTSLANTVNLEANSFRIISNQISNWLSNISKNIDFGMNYTPGDDINPNEIEFMFKADLFDNRVIIDGNIGVQNNTGTVQQASNFVGDFMVEYKITKDGRLRAKAFNRSNEYNLIEANGPYTQGIGLSYYTEFDKFSDLFRKKKKRK